ncbi:MAG: trypsin-like peptidase domain-containing protein [Candidatus Brocadiaceae bacterium]|nr:trypsin-like peptidase domain-containing protein [Candidatus Brocadiaceae bacterium]
MDKKFIFTLILSSLTFLSGNLAFAQHNDIIEKLRDELLELEEITKPFVRTFQKVSQLVSPSVVSLITKKKGDSESSSKGEPRSPSPKFPPEHDSHPENVPKRGLGSGIIVDERGYILTNNHVISGFSEEEITVVTFEEKQYKNVKITGVDPNTDLAVIKIDGENFLPITFGNSEEVQVGDWVVAIGNPFGFQQTVSTGIISAKGRTHVIPFELPFLYEDFLQTDAAINPGNSGGPLVNLRGELVGVNTAIATRSGGFQGVGFAISSRIAEETVKNIIATGTVVRGYLGVGTHDITDDLAEVLGLKDKNDLTLHFALPTEKGAFVMEVWSDTPASKAGILPGDIILDIGGNKVENTMDLQYAIRQAGINKKVLIKVIREGYENTLEAVIEPQPKDLAGKTYIALRRLDETRDFSLGLVVDDLSPEIAKTLGLEGEKGVLVIEVQENSPAAHAGIEPGDLITNVGTNKVSSVLEFMTLMNEYLDTNKPISIYIKNKGFVTLK